MPPRYSTRPPRRGPHPGPHDTRLTRRRLAGVLGGAAATALAGCGSDATAADPTTLQVWGGIPGENGPQRVVDEFMKKYPEYNVRYTRYVNDARGNLKLNTALQGGLDIDVFFTYSTQDLAMRATSGLSADIAEQVGSGPKLAAFLASGFHR